jgi:hypothetical protein
VYGVEGFTVRCGLLFDEEEEMERQVVDAAFSEVA